MGMLTKNNVTLAMTVFGGDMFLFIWSCLASKVTNLENDVALLQEQNASLERKLNRIEQQQATLESKMSTKHTQAKGNEDKPKNIDERIMEAMSQAKRKEITVSKQRFVDEGINAVLGVRLLQHQHSQGFVDGIRIFSIKRDSLFWELGLRNGDVLIAVNGQPSSDVLNNLPSQNYDATLSRLVFILNPESYDTNEITILIERRNKHRLLVITLEQSE